MKTLRGLISVLLIVILALSTSGCSTLAQIFATATPTNTPTPLPTATATYTLTPLPTATSTFTLTPSVTPTPLPPLAISACAYSEDCPNAKMINSFLPDGQSVEYNQAYVLTIPYDADIRFRHSWCAIDRYTLDQNLAHYQFTFTINGTSYVDSLAKTYITQTSASDPNVTYPCLSMGVVLTGWKIGKVHSITIGGKVTDNIFDGWDNYTPGSNLITYFLNPDVVPTDTLTPTPSNTPQPTATWIPPTDVPYVAPTPSCGEKGDIHISNTTGGYVSLHLAGKVSYDFYIGAGDNTITVCSGSYDYTAYGCGGASNTGSMSSGDSHEFYCQ